MFRRESALLNRREFLTGIATAACGMLAPGLGSAAPRWTFTQAQASGIRDVAAFANISTTVVFICGTNGTVWRTEDNGRHFHQITGSGLRRLAGSPDGSLVYGVGDNGALWASSTPGIWQRVATESFGRPVEDAVVNFDRSLWITTQNGQMWSIRDGRTWEPRTVLAAFKRIGIGPGQQFWGIDSGGTLLQRDGSIPGSAWYDTAGSGMEDVSVSNTGRVWLVGSNGTVWTTFDGQVFEQLDASNFLAVAAAAGDSAWLVGRNGLLFHVQKATATPVRPPSRPPTPVTQRLIASIADHSAEFGLLSVTWRLYRQEFGGLTFVSARTGATAELTPPGNGQYYLYAEVSVLRQGSLEAELAEFRGNTVIDGIPVLTFVWSGTSQAKNFRLVSERSGGFFSSINPVVVS
jgi:hypothetical protein